MKLRYCPQCASELVTRELGGKNRLTCPDPNCAYTFWDNPVPVVSGIVEYEGNVVLTRNHGWPSGMWGIVAGFLERDETPEEAVVREISEELHLEARIVSMVGIYPFYLRNQIIFAYHLEASGKIEIGEELAGIKLVPPAKLKPWSRGTGLAVRDWLLARGLLSE